MFESTLLFDDPDLPIPASLRTPDNVPEESTTHTSIEGISPLSKASVESKQRKRISKSQKFFPEHLSKIQLNVKKKRKELK
jgi:hypothetical protein